MSIRSPEATEEQVPLLPEDVPVEMPELPLSLEVSTVEQLKAFADTTRTRILGILQNEPATAKQIADRLKLAPGTVGHHLQVLEEAGLAQVVARRLVRGIVAKYYTRTARIFSFRTPAEVRTEGEGYINILGDARAEQAEAHADFGLDATLYQGMPHARLSPERVAAYQERLEALLDDFNREPPDPNGEIYALALALFKSPAYLQRPREPQPPVDEAENESPIPEEGGA